MILSAYFLENLSAENEMSEISSSQTSATYSEALISTLPGETNRAAQAPRPACHILFWGKWPHPHSPLSSHSSLIVTDELISVDPKGDSQLINWPVTYSLAPKDELVQWGSPFQNFRTCVHILSWWRKLRPKSYDLETGWGALSIGRWRHEGEETVRKPRKSTDRDGKVEEIPESCHGEGRVEGTPIHFPRCLAGSSSWSWNPGRTSFLSL